MEKVFEVSRSEVRRAVTAVPGICRRCGCSEDNPCRLADGEPCCWMDCARTLCNNPSCLTAESARRRLIVASRPRRLTSADVHDLIRGRGRKRSCRAAAPYGMHGGSKAR